MSDLVSRYLRRLPAVKALSEELEATRAQRDQARAERDSSRAAEQALGADRDAMLVTRDAAIATEASTRAERDTAIAERDAAIAERDAAIAERDAARTATELMRAELDAERQALLGRHDTTSDQLAELGSDMERLAAKEIRERFCLLAGRNSAASPNAIIVPVHGPVSDREIAVTQPFFENYCRAIGADLRIIDVPSTIPNLLVRASLLPVARKYRRFAIVDPDVLIREHCPDLFSIVSEDRLGAVVEGHRTDRGENCAELARMYGRSRPLPAERFIDTGVMVMSAAHLSVLETLAGSPLTPHPRDEQGFINAVLYRDDVPIQSLPREFNWIPYRSEEFDWRFAWIFHIADNWRSPPRTDSAWRLHERGINRVAAPTPLSPCHVRLSSLIEISRQILGSNTRIFHPADMGFHPPMGQLVLLADDRAVMRCEPTIPGRLEPPPIYGPYAQLEPGRWLVTLSAADHGAPANSGTVVDVVCNGGSTTLRPKGPIGPDGAFEIILESELRDVEVRLYQSVEEAVIGSITFSQVSD